MEGILYFTLYIALPICIPVGLSLYLASRKKMFAAKLLMAIGVAIPFFMIGVVVLFICLWGGHPRPHDNEYYCQPFVVTNYSSTDLVADACFAYTREELEKFEWDSSLPLANFITYSQVPIPIYTASRQMYSNRYTFDTPIRCDSCTHWPSGFYLLLSDTQGTPLAYFHTDNLDSLAQHNMQIDVTDSLLNVMSPSIMLLPKQKGGDQ